MENIKEQIEEIKRLTTLPQCDTCDLEKENARISKSISSANILLADTLGTILKEFDKIVESGDKDRAKWFLTNAVLKASKALDTMEDVELDMARKRMVFS